MSKLLTLPLVAIALVLQPAPAVSQAEGLVPTIGSAQPGSFAQKYPEAASHLNTVSGAYGTLIEQLNANSGASIESSTVTQLLGMIRSGSGTPTTLTGAAPSFTASARQVADALAWGDAFQTAIYDIYADDAIADKSAAVEQAVDRYLSRSDVAVVASPKFMMMAMAGGGGMHGGHGAMAMEMDAHHSEMFKTNYPVANGLVWATQWYEIALFDPLMFYSTESEREAGIEAVVSRFQEMLSGAPASFPMEMPTPAAVSPELVRLHPRAAAIIDNVHKLGEAVTDAVVHEATRDKRMALNAALIDMQDPEHMAVSEYDWILNSLRNGIYYQGGPAIGRLQTSERNRGHGDHGGSAVMPGMGGPSGTGICRDAR